MKKLFYLVLLATLVCCKQDRLSRFESVDTNSDLLSQSLKYLQKNVESFDGKHLALSSTVNRQATPSLLVSGELNWDKVKSYNLTQFDNIEVPYLATNNTINVYNFRKRMYEDDEHDRKLRAIYSYTNMLFYRPAGTIEPEALLITYIPERGAIENMNYFKTGERMTLSNLDYNFTGYIEYRKLNSEVLFILYVVRGNVSFRYTVDSKEKSTKSRSAQSTSSCRTVCTPIYATICSSVPESLDDEETCTLRVVGQNCELVCDNTNPNPGYPYPPGSGGGNGASNAEVEGYINDIIELCENFDKNSAGYKKFMDEVFYLADPQLSSGIGFPCAFKDMLKIIKSDVATNGKLTWCIDPNVETNAYYDAKTRVLAFNNEVYIDARDVFHEFFHVLQDIAYPGGIGQYRGKPGHSEMEFENRLFMDIIMQLDPQNPKAFPVTNGVYESYNTWVGQFVKTSNGTTHLGQARIAFADPGIGTNEDYVFYKNAFYSQFGDPSHPTLAPLAIKLFFERSNCNQL